HEARIALIYPLAAVFALFGTSEASLALLPLVASALTASLVAWLALRLRGAFAGFAAGLSYAFLPLTVGLATFCVPEPLVGLEMCVAVALVLRAVEDGAPHPRILVFAAGLVVGIAYLTTEVGALMLPVIGLWLALSRRFEAKRDAHLLAGFLVVLLVELVHDAAV